MDAQWSLLMRMYGRKYTSLTNLSDDTGLLEQILLNERTLDHTVLVEVHINVLSEARRVVVTDGLGVSEC
jgi:hypothetical protein